MKISCWYEKDGCKECHVNIDKSTRNGIVHFSKELSVEFKVINNAPIWQGCWAIVCGETITYNSEEKDIFDKDYPGVWDEIVEACKDENNFQMLKKLHVKKEEEI